MGVGVDPDGHNAIHCLKRGPGQGGRARPLLGAVVAAVIGVATTSSEMQ